MLRVSNRVRRRRLTRGLLGAIAVLLCARPSAAPSQTVPDLQRILKDPLTPASLARLVPHGSSSPVADRIAQGLSHSDASIRAAAARVAFVTGLTALAPRLVVALDAESAADAAFEQGRALAHFAGTEHDGRIVEAWRRTGAGHLLLALAAARGRAALDLLPALRAEKDRDVPHAAFLRIASGDDAALFAEAAARAVAGDDSTLYAAALEAARASGAAVPDGVLAAALRAPARAFGHEAISHYMVGWTGDDRPQMSEPLQAAMLAFAAAHPATDPASTLANEFASRAAGQTPRADGDWMTLLVEHADLLAGYRTFPNIRRLLTGAEAEALTRVKKLPSTLPPGLTRPPASSAASRPALRTATGYPKGFMESVVSGTGCRYGEAAGVGELTFRPRGTVARVGLHQTAVPRQCEEAVRLLLMTYTPAPDRVMSTTASELVMVPLLRGYIDCQADAPMAASRWRGVGPGSVTPPKKVRDVRPRYPASAQTDGVEGPVVAVATITSTGCISRAEILSSVDPRLDWAALLAVLQWGFTPVLVAGAPTDIIMTVTVNFRLS